MSDENAAAQAAAAGDEAAFSGLAERYRRELRVHCYRMLGSYDDAEDLVQDTYLRAWKHHATFGGRSTFRAWLYRIATNACLDFLARHPRRALPAATEPAMRPSAAPLSPAAVPWLQPFPDALLDPVPSDDPGPDAAVVDKETIELAFLAAIQHLPPRQRAVLILRDVLGWSAKETAAGLDSTVASVNSALQRARPTLRRHLPRQRSDWAPAGDPSEAERAVLQRYMDAIGRADDAGIAAVLREDARVGHQAGAGGLIAPEPAWYSGRDTILAGWAPVLHGPDARELRMVVTRANRQPALATYIRTPGESAFHGFGLAVVEIDLDSDGAGIAEMTVFLPSVFPAFGLPETL